MEYKQVYLNFDSLTEHRRINNIGKTIKPISWINIENRTSNQRAHYHKDSVGCSLTAILDSDDKDSILKIS